MPEWTKEMDRVVDGVSFSVQREVNRRWPYWIIKATIDGMPCGFWYIDHAKWQGHCNGQLLFPAFATQAKRMHAGQFDPSI